MMEKKRDTIAAVATPFGEGAIGIVRISGPDTLRIVKEIFKTPSGKIKPRFAHYGEVINPESGDTLDEGILIFYKAPRSYTGEDMAELNLHGNPLILGEVLNLILSRGARLAEPGEFTKRAFLNGKLDLTQAEAVAELISAKTELARKLALNQLKGALSNEIKPLREELLNLHALVESSIEFEEEDIPTITPEELKERIEAVLKRVKNLLRTAKTGNAIRRGIKMAIIGRPNVGKSSLFNRLLGEERAIVSSVAGTTRDFIEETVNIGGIPIRLIDTAGIREAVDEIEKIGVERSLKKLEEADVILFVLDASQPLTEEDLRLAHLVSRADKPTVVALNKIDLGEVLKDLPEEIGKFPAVRVSAKTGEGLDGLRKEILRNAGIFTAEGGNIYISIRHAELLKSAERALKNALQYLEGGFFSPEILMLDLREATDSLGEIIGAVATEDVLGQIFSTFCIGK
jgi:tRNA modification GTPase